MAHDSTRSSKRPRYGSSDPIQGSADMTTRTSSPREVLAGKPEETSILIGSHGTNSGRCRLRKGMVILKNFLSASEQAELVAHVHHLGCLSEGGFYPCHNEKTKRMRMMNLGLRTDGGRHTLKIPRAWTEIAVRACREAAEIDASIPILRPDVCVVNHYTTASRLGWHQDLLSSRDPGLPVVSLSLGDAATFQYRLSWKKTAGVKSVMLESGDAFVFGGRSRGIIHAVPSIITSAMAYGSPSGTSPRVEAPEPGEKTRRSSSCCVPGGGRFNLNFREL